MTVRSSGLVLSAVTAGVLGLGFAGPAYAVEGDRDCADFDSQADAQAAYDEDPSDPERLDSDDDGEACESFFDGPGSGSEPGPEPTEQPSDDASDAPSDDASDAPDEADDDGQLPVGGVAAGGGGTAGLLSDGSSETLPAVPALVGIGGVVLFAAGVRLAHRAR